ncbi:hypothetical protein [Xanthomonas phage Xp15]|uniref:Uncharacterized protein n=1 Tax=Xanthomonas phage Xp15 TaxID=322855 RepID=Q52PU0_9CAUD|nr:hypothetical protein XPXV15_gp71 [Xanthomonas phage Xp15]AAX84907.1 hypothetical protein [Xanthomonas phage Xp15]
MQLIKVTYFSGRVMYFNPNNVVTITRKPDSTVITTVTPSDYVDGVPTYEHHVQEEIDKVLAQISPYVDVMILGGS